jgi:NAD(P)-dependent dehydrogenase (short-subunit alcohol dehydrogenase family)
MGRRKEKLDEVVAEIEEAGGVALAAPGSVTSEDDVQASINVALRSFGKIDILINNAGVAGSGAPVHEMSDETWHQVIETNLTGIFRMTRAVLPSMIRAGGGSIVNVASVSGLVSFLSDAAYSSTKAGVILLTKHVAIEYAKQRIRCNCVCPAVVRTPMVEPFIPDTQTQQAVNAMHPLGRIATPEEVARAIYYLASDDAGFVTGSVLTIDGGVTAGVTASPPTLHRRM